MLDDIVTEIEADGRRPQTRECVAMLADRIFRSAGVALQQTLLAFAAHQVDGYFGQKRRGRRVWELWPVTDDEGREAHFWVRRADLTARGAERVLRYNRGIEATHHDANTQRDFDRQALLMRDPSGEQLRLGDLVEEE